MHPAGGQAGIGVRVSGSGNTMGGTTPAARNVISGNNEEGIVLASGATNNELLGNLIGTEKDGITPLGNTDSGIFIGLPDNIGGILNASDNLVGGSSAEAANTIAFNGADGITVEGNPTSNITGNRILRNSIFSNTGLGIDLADDGPTANDFGDFDTGPNDLQNFPVLASATVSGGSTTVRGTLRSADNRTLSLRFFSNPSGTNEGKKFIGMRSVTTNADGSAPFTFESAQTVPAGRTITATATDAGGNTSEFSAPREVVQG